MPHSSEAIEKPTMHMMKKRLRPITEASHPEIGSTIALVTRYEVSTQVDSSWLAARSPAIWRSDTLAMEMSSTSMKAAIATTGATSHGAAGMAPEPGAPDSAAAALCDAVSASADGVVLEPDGGPSLIFPGLPRPLFRFRFQFRARRHRPPAPPTCPARAGA